MKCVLTALLNNREHDLTTVLKRPRQVIVLSQTGRQNISGCSPPAYVIINIQTQFKKTIFSKDSIPAPALLKGSWKHLRTQPGGFIDMGGQCPFGVSQSLASLTFNALEFKQCWRGRNVLIFIKQNSLEF